MRGLGDAVYAVNCGGEAHTDLFGVKVLKALSLDANRYNEYCIKSIVYVNWQWVLFAVYIGHKCKMFQYEKDMSKVGTPSDYGKQLMIGNRHININQLNKFDDNIYLQEN